MRSIRVTGLLLLLASGLALGQPLTSSEQAVLDRISANAIAGHVAYLASDALEGRGTYTHGLDMAAEYIASEFKSAGLTPGGDKEFYQTATITRRDGTERKSQNVVGVLVGSDPVLRDTYVIVSAHYDHLGIRPDREGDNIYNGANDDASGTAGVIQLAHALGKMDPRPKRSILLMCFFGEEMGLVGSRYYGAHPTVPLEKIIAQINLEQIGRTDDTEAPRVGKLAMTGFDYSDLGNRMNAAAMRIGIAIEKHPQFSDAFFSRSDNQAIADVGIPAHTLCAAFEYPDYHKASDHWDKLNYPNFETILRGVALGVLDVANSPVAPTWNADNPKASKYLEAWKKLHQGSALAPASR